MRYKVYTAVLMNDGSFLVECFNISLTADMYNAAVKAAVKYLGPAGIVIGLDQDVVATVRKGGSENEASQ